VATRPPAGPGWVHELKQDGYRLQIHLHAGRVRLFTMNGHDWTERYPLIVRDGTKIKNTAILDGEVVCADGDGKPDFDLLHSRCNDDVAVACAFDLLMLDGDDIRRLPFALRKAMLAKLVRLVHVDAATVAGFFGFVLCHRNLVPKRRGPMPKSRAPL
jgi:bifunctional non-homologous end joining protein LigD